MSFGSRPSVWLGMALFCGSFSTLAYAGPITVRATGKGWKGVPTTTTSTPPASSSSNAGGNGNGGNRSIPGPTASPAVESLSCEAGCHNELFGGAVWSTDNIFHPSGTGVFQPFLRLQAHGNNTTEDGHNTDAKSTMFANDEKGGIWTHSVPMTAFTPGTVDGYTGLFYGFALDFGEPAVLGKSLLSLDALKMCTSNNPSLVTPDDCPTNPYYYDLDAGTNREVLLDYNLVGRGNGASDLFVYVPMSYFATNTNQYFYLYSMFGQKGGAYGADGTFAEWAFFDEPTQRVPEPGSLMLLAFGIIAIAVRRRGFQGA